MSSKKITEVVLNISKAYEYLNIENFVISDIKNPTGATKKINISDLPSMFKSGDNVGVHSTSTTLDPLDKFVIIFVLFTLKRLFDVSIERLNEGRAKGENVSIPLELNWDDLLKSPDHLLLRNAYSNLKKIYQPATGRGPITVPEYLDIGWENLDFGNLNGEKQRSIINIFNELKLSLLQFPGKEITDIGTRLIEELLQDYKGKYWIPTSLSQLLVRLFNPIEKFVHDPACGLGSIVFSLDKYRFSESEYCYIAGNESNQKILGLLQLRHFLSSDFQDPVIPWKMTPDIDIGVFSSLSLLSEKFNKIIKDIWDDEEEAFMVSDQTDIVTASSCFQHPLVLCVPPFDEKPKVDGRGKDKHLREIRVDVNRSSKEKSKTTLSLPKNSTGFSYILHSLFALEATRVGIILPNFLLGGGSEENGSEEKIIRKYLIDEDFIETIIKLPDHILGNQSKSSSILILNKKKYKERANKILFMNACTSEEDSEVISTSEIERIIETHDKFLPSLLDDHIASVEDIRNNDYILNPDDYIHLAESRINSISTKEQWVPLEEICGVSGECSSGAFPIKAPIIEAPVIDEKDLPKEFCRKYLEYKNWEHCIIRSIAASYIVLSDKRPYFGKPCILLANVDGSWASAIFNPQETTEGNKELKDSFIERNNLNHEEPLNLAIFIEKTIFTIQPMDDLVDLNYLYCQINNPLVIRQLNQMIKGNPTGFLRETQLKSVRIPLGTIEEQKEFAKDRMARALEEEVERHNLIRENLELKETRERLNKEQLNLKQKQLDTIDHLSHNISPKIMNLKSIGRHLKEFLRDNGVADYPLIEPMDKQQTVEKAGESIDTLLNNLTQVDDLISHTGGILRDRFTANDFIRLNLKQTFEEIKSCFSNEKFKISIATDNLKNGDFLVHKVLLKEAVNNLINNARDHGFNDPALEGRIDFRLSSYMDGVIIEYTNNGSPMNENIGEDEFLEPFVKGPQSSGRGLGGGWVRSLVNAHSGKFEILKTPKYNVHFKITLGKANISEKK